ncbi:MFS transporter [Taklimakanibacter lacteus]|uniref:MFS transporter n=1 Tax=Taklimakanibacter lacteus TaxID=2268456 RepID=UPI000E662DCE
MPQAEHRLDTRRWRILALLALAIVLTLTTWFSAAAVIPELEREWQLSPHAVSWLANGVQIGFVCGALTASLVILPDVARLNWLMASGAALAALSNALLLLEPGPVGAIALRVMTGVALAGVYPPALKLVSTWFDRDRGLALGVVIGALTLGSSLPHLFRGLAHTIDWHVVVAASSLSALAGAVLFALFAQEGPCPFGRAVFDPRQIGPVFRNRDLLLANLGYFGHMWELYAMWAWLLIYVKNGFAAQALPSPTIASLVTFAAIAVGALGCILGGVLSDLVGRTLTTAGMMAVSGLCALLVGLTFDGPPWLFVLVILVWGISIVGDSAQFSAAVSELADQRFVGTALSAQLGIGFALTALAVWLIPLFAGSIGSWQWAFLMLVPGPLVGMVAMLLLRRSPASLRLAKGRR